MTTPTPEDPVGPRRLRLAPGGARPIDRRPYLANRAVSDAERLALKLRDVNPALTWSTLVRWCRDDPERLVAVAFALLAMLPVDSHSTRSLLAWTEPTPPVRRAGRLATRRTDHG